MQNQKVKPYLAIRPTCLPSSLPHLLRRSGVSWSPTTTGGSCLGVPVECPAGLRGEGQYLRRSGRERRKASLSWGECRGRSLRKLVGGCGGSW